MSLFDPRLARKRIDAVYSQMRERAKPKKWKTGRRQGRVKTAGIVGLPFTRQELWEYALKEIGPTGVARCPYCVEIGRPATVIDIFNLVFDHVVPLKRGGTWELSNIRVCCEDCNRLKGHLSYQFFVGIMSAVEKWTDPADRSAFHACLRTHGLSQRLRGFHGKPKEQPPPETGTLALQENF